MQITPLLREQTWPLLEVQMAEDEEHRKWQRCPFQLQLFVPADVWVLRRQTRRWVCFPFL